MSERTIELSVPAGALGAELAAGVSDRGLIVFAHGSGSSRRSPRNRRVAETFRGAGFGTLLFDLLTPEEQERDAETRELRFDVALIGERMTAAVDAARERVGDTPVGLFGASTGAAAALVAAADRPQRVSAVVSRGGRPDLAKPWLDRVRAPTLLIVGELDTPVIAMNRSAQESLAAPNKLEIVAGASHLFEEPGTLDQVAALAREWFDAHL